MSNWSPGFPQGDNTAVIKPAPAELAKLSLQLAEIFRKVEKVFTRRGPAERRLQRRAGRHG